MFLLRGILLGFVFRFCFFLHGSLMASTKDTKRTPARGLFIKDLSHVGPAFRD